MDCVLSYHLNPWTCGVAKFNSILANRLGVPLLNVFDPKAVWYEQPLISIKMSEFSQEDAEAWEQLLDIKAPHWSFRLFLHDYSQTEVEAKMLRRAAVVYCGNSELVDRLRPLREDVIELWCPGTLLDNHPFTPGEVSVFTFGMAHKVRPEFYRKLHELLSATGKSFCMYLSTALHEGTSFDDSFLSVFHQLRDIFGSSVHFMGYLSDAATYNYLVNTTFFAAFFDKGVRANNTSVLAAMQSGAVVISNLDAHSPEYFRHLENVLDINRCQELPTDGRILGRIGDAAKEMATNGLGWDALISNLRKQHSLSPCNNRGLEVDSRAGVTEVEGIPELKL